MSWDIQELYQIENILSKKKDSPKGFLHQVTPFSGTFHKQAPGNYLCHARSENHLLLSLCSSISSGAADFPFGSFLGNSFSLIKKAMTGLQRRRNSAPPVFPPKGVAPCVDWQHCQQTTRVSRAQLPRTEVPVDSPRLTRTLFCVSRRLQFPFEKS